MDDKDRINRTLFMATQADNVGAMKEAIALGADVDYVHIDSAFRYSSLLLAAHQGNQETAEALMAAGASLQLKDRYNRTAVDLAAQFAKEDFAIWLAKKAGPLVVKSKFAIAIAASRSYLRLIDLLVEAGCDPSVSGPDGDRPLRAAVWSGNLLTVEKMLSLGADVNEVFAHRYSALHHAAEKGYVSIAERLIAAGANVNARQVAGFTPIHCAAMHDCASMIDLLVSVGTDPLALGNQGDTAYQYAREFGKVQAMEALETLGFGEPMSQEELNRHLVEAAKNNFIGLVGKLVDMGADPNVRSGGRTLLQIGKSAEVKQAILAARSGMAIAQATEGEAPLAATRRSSTMSPI